MDVYKINYDTEPERKVTYVEHQSYKKDDLVHHEIKRIAGKNFSNEGINITPSDMWSKHQRKIEDKSKNNKKRKRKN